MKSNVTTAPTIPFTEITLHLSNLLFILPNIAHAIIGMIVFIISVGTAHTANPVNISAIAEPIPPASAPTTGPKKNAHISITLSPKCAYPKGIGICTTIVATHVSAINTAVIHICVTVI